MNNDIRPSAKYANTVSPDSRHSDSYATVASLASDNDDATLDQPSTIVQSDTNSSQNLMTRFSLRRILFRSLLGIGLVIGVSLILFSINSNKQEAALQASAEGANAKIKLQSIPLLGLSNQLSTNTAQHVSTVTVNGQVNVGNSLVMTPTAKPSDAVAGQIYYDQTSNLLSYYNGTGFVGLQGGGNVTNNITNVTNNAAPITNTTNVTNVTNNTTTSGGGGGNTTSTGTPGTIALFTAANTLGDSLITQAGTTVNVGGTTDNVGTAGANETVNLGSLVGTSTTNVQGGLGNLNVLTGPQAGSTGNITIQSGDSSTTAAGNISIDTGNSIINGTIVGNKDFESGIDNMADSIFGDNSVVAQSNAQAHGGTHSLAISVGSTFFPEWGIADGAGNPPMIIPVSQGHTYAVSAWVRAGTTSCTITASVTWSNDGYYGGGQISQQNYGTVTDISTGWRHVTGVVTAPAGAVSMGFGFISFDATTIGETHYFDDITITDLSSSTSSASINIGATNAQIVTIGNSGMLAPTSIYGGGVNIAAGSGIMNLSATTLTASAGGASLTTTTGALDLTAATSSTWKIGNSGGGGGNLNIASGNAGGNGNGGNLTLQAGTGSGTGTGGSVYVGTGSGATFGYTTLGNFGYSNQNNAINAAKFTTTTGGTVQSMSVRIGDFGLNAPPNNQYQIAIYTDNAGVPGNYIASSAIGTLASSAAWNTLPITATLAPTTSYWLVYWTNAITGGGTNAEIGTPGSGTFYGAVDTWQTGTNNGMPTTIPLGGTFNTINTSIYATYAGSAPAVTIDTHGTLTQNGAAIFQDPADIPNAFQIQNSAGTALLTADTSAMTITVQSLIVNATLTVDGHVITGGIAPTVGTPANCGTGPTAAITAASNDTAGSFTITTGSGAGSTCDTTVTFNQPYGSAPKSIILTPTIGVGGATVSSEARVSSATTTTFTVQLNTPNPSLAYSYYYWVVQ